MKLLLTDNNDSFTYNLAELVDSVFGNRPDIMLTADAATRNLAEYDGIILSPGPGLPEDFPGMHKILSEYGGIIPILGVCLGHQSICTYFGGSLFYMQEVLHGYPEEIKVSDESSRLFRNFPNQFKAGLYHSIAVSRDTLPKTLTITAVSQRGIIMAVEHVDFPVYGIQFHPESFITEHGKALIKNFPELQ